LLLRPPRFKAQAVFSFLGTAAQQQGAIFKIGPEAEFKVVKLGTGIA